LKLYKTLNMKIRDLTRFMEEAGFSKNLANIFHAPRLSTPEGPNLRLSYVTHTYLAPYSKHCKFLHYKFRATLPRNAVHLFILEASRLRGTETDCFWLL
jgi:hypothetical protein